MALRRKKIITRETIATVPPMKVAGWLQGFVDFIREQGVVGLAVGLVLGVAAKGVVDSLVANIFNPIIGVLTGGVDLGDRAICLQKNVEDVCVNNLKYGAVISEIISFLIVAAVVYFVIKGLHLDKLDKPKSK